MDTVESDREEILGLHRAYLAAYAALDPEPLVGVLSGEGKSLYYAVTGHAYRGTEDWGQLWEYLRPRITFDGLPEYAFDQQLRVERDVAWLTSTRVSLTQWLGEESTPFNVPPSPVRATEIYVREAVGWRLTHMHVSRVSLEPRPGGI